MSYTQRPGLSQTPQNFCFQVACIFLMSRAHQVTAVLLVLFSKYIIPLQVGLRGDSLSQEKKKSRSNLYQLFFSFPYALWCISSQVETESHLAFTTGYQIVKTLDVSFCLTCLKSCNSTMGNIVFCFKMEQKISISTASDILAPTLRCTSAKKKTRPLAQGSLRLLKQSRFFCTH